MGVSRRALLLGGGLAALFTATGIYALVEEGVLPGRIRLNQALAGLPIVGDDEPVAPSTAAGPLVSGAFFSRARGTRVEWSVAYPPGFDVDADLPVSLLLHGRYEDHAWMFGDLSLQHYLAQAVEAGVPAFALASVDGGSATNWHPRASGDNPLAMLTSEFLPLLSRRGLRTERIGIWGWSLGGYGALLLASELGPRAVAAVVAASPALWQAAEDTAPGVFDDPEDFERHDVFSRVEQLRGIPLRIDVGDDDSFAPNVQAFIDVLPTPPAGGVRNGLHDAAFWMRAAPDEIAFLGEHLG